jgi:hypothetical protein
MLLSAPFWWHANLAALDSVEPSVRSGSRSLLMATTPDRLELLLDEARSTRLTDQQLASLSEIVMHLHIASINEREGAELAQLGIRSQQPRFEVEQDLPAGARVGSRVMGYDAQRALEDGDRIVQIGFVDPHGPTRQWDIAQFEDLREVTGAVRPGATIDVTLIRDGRRISTRLRLARIAPGLDDQDRMASYQRWLVSARRFWKDDVLPTLKR